MPAKNPLVPKVIHSLRDVVVRAALGADALCAFSMREFDCMHRVKIKASRLRA
jgi:hypothetical protein